MLLIIGDVGYYSQEMFLAERGMAGPSSAGRKRRQTAGDMSDS